MKLRLNEEIDKIKSMMNIKKRPIFNISLIEELNDDTENGELSNDKDFSNSKVQKVVWRAGWLKLIPENGGIWFAETKKGVEDFAWSVRREKREGKPYYINLENPYYIDDGFWHGYVYKVYHDKNGRKTFMEKLINEGYDGIIIADDWWNDTGDKYAVYSKQYIVFDEKNIKPAS